MIVVLLPLRRYSAAFGAAYANKGAKKGAPGVKDAPRLRREYGDCFFRFTLVGDLPKAARRGAELGARAFRWKRAADKIHLLVPLDASRLPYSAPRRNVKVLKMLGHRLFPWAERLLWADAKLRIGEHDPRAYFRETVEAPAAGAGVCAAFVGLPLHRHAYGDGAVDAPSLARHAETILGARARGRPDVTDSEDALRAQVRAYAREGGAAAEPERSRALVDSAYLAFDRRDERCRRFHAALGCAWFDEVHCFSDRDQLSFPVALAKLGVRARGDAAAEPYVPGRTSRLLSDARGRPTAYIVAPGTKPGQKGAMHWYYSKAVALWGSG